MSDILEEVKSNREVNYSFLKAIDCLAYVHINSTLKTKLDVKPKKCFLIGYTSTKYCYCLRDNQNY